MKKKLISILLVIIILLSYSNCIFAENTALETGTSTSNTTDNEIDKEINSGEGKNNVVIFNREKAGGAALNTIAEQITEDIYIDGDYSAVSNGVAYSDISIYEYNTTTAQTKSDSEITYTKNKYYLKAIKRTTDGIDYNLLYYTLKFPSGTQSVENVATFIYKDGITYKGKKYDLKFNIKKIEKSGNDEAEIAIQIGRRKDQAENRKDESTYTDKAVYPYIHLYGSEDKKVEVETEYYILDKSGNQVPISGLMSISDIDLNQGFFINDYIAAPGNVFMNQNNDLLRYKVLNNGTYIYASNDQGTNNNNAYVLVTNKSSMNVVFTWDSNGAGSQLEFISDVIKRYKKITTKVTGGTITESITNIKDGENKTITYLPGKNKYLKSITVDGTPIDIKQNPEKYDFTNITEDHTIEVVYEDKLTVEHDPKGGHKPNEETSTYEIQYVIPNEKAATVTEPIKTGYTFERWQKTGTTTPFDYNTPITESTKLEAVWKPIIYTITYITNGGTNDPSNPENYTVEDTIDFKNPTREGYDFLGWYEDKDLTKKKDGISHETGNKTVYAKWEAKKDIPYKVEHYKETTKGNYELVIPPDELTATTDSTVTAKAKEYTGFTENKTHKDRIASGKVASDGSLVLKLYYDKINYTVTFDTKGGSENPEDQIVRYNDKATKPTNPTKQGYIFRYWYYINEDGKEVQYDFDDPVIKDINLLAKWEEVKEEPKVEPKEEPKEEPKQEEKNVSPAALPKTGENENIINSLPIVVTVLIIITVAGVICKFKYNNLKDIK